MTAHPYDDIEAFAIGGLDDTAAAQVLEHADRCTTCAVLIAQAMETAAAMEPRGERPLQRPIHVRSAASATNVGSPIYWRPKPHVGSPIHWRPKPAVLLGSLATVAILALLMWNINLRSTRFDVPIASLVHSHFEHHALHGISGAAKVIQALDGSWLYVVADGLEPRSQYYLWEVTAGKEREVGSFATNPDGRATAFYRQPATRIQAFVISNTAREPTNGGELRWP